MLTPVARAAQSLAYAAASGGQKSTFWTAAIERDYAPKLRSKVIHSHLSKSLYFTVDTKSVTHYYICSTE